MYHFKPRGKSVWSSADCQRNLQLQVETRTNNSVDEGQSTLEMKIRLNVQLRITDPCCLTNFALLFQHVAHVHNDCHSKQHCTETSEKCWVGRRLLFFLSFKWLARWTVFYVISGDDFYYFMVKSAANFAVFALICVPNTCHIVTLSSFVHGCNFWMQRFKPNLTMACILLA